MKKSEVADLLIIIKAFWQDQSIEDTTVAGWSELLSEIGFEAAKKAVRNRARLGMERPNAGQVYKEAQDLAMREMDKGKTHRLLKAPDETPEQQAKNKQFFKDFLKTHAPDLNIKKI